MVLAGLIDSPEPLSVGEDFLLPSSARFEPDKIDVTKRIGLDLVLPLAAIFPFERHIQWVGQKQIGAKVAEELLGGTASLATALIGKVKFVGPKGFVASKLADKTVGSAVALAADLSAEQLRKLNSEAKAKQDYMTAVLTGFGLDLDMAEDDRVLLRSRR